MVYGVLNILTVERKKFCENSFTYVTLTPCISICLFIHLFKKQAIHLSIIVFICVYMKIYTFSISDSPSSPHSFSPSLLPSPSPSVLAFLSLSLRLCLPLPLPPSMPASPCLSLTLPVCPLSISHSDTICNCAHARNSLYSHNSLCTHISC